MWHHTENKDVIPKGLQQVLKLKILKYTKTEQHYLNPNPKWS